jgi:hypothetical protein
MQFPIYTYIIEQNRKLYRVIVFFCKFLLFTIDTNNIEIWHQYTGNSKKCGYGTTWYVFVVGIYDAICLQMLIFKHHILLFCHEILKFFAEIWVVETINIDAINLKIIWQNRQIACLIEKKYIL